MFRFYVGRNAPEDLAVKRRANRTNVRRGTRAFGAEGIADMLIGRKNLTFRTPTGWLPYMVHTVFPQLMFLPPVYRYLAQHLLRVAVLAVIGMAGYDLLRILGSAGVIEADGMLHSRSVRFLVLAALTAVVASLRPSPANVVGPGCSGSSLVSVLILLLSIVLTLPTTALEPRSSRGLGLLVELPDRRDPLPDGTHRGPVRTVDYNAGSDRRGPADRDLAVPGVIAGHGGTPLQCCLPRQSLSPVLSRIPIGRHYVGGQ